MLKRYWRSFSRRHPISETETERRERATAKERARKMNEKTPENNVKEGKERRE